MNVRQNLFIECNKHMDFDLTQYDLGKQIKLISLLKVPLEMELQALYISLE